jgi:hypothetical protein
MERIATILLISGVFLIAGVASQHVIAQTTQNATQQPEVTVGDAKNMTVLGLLKLSASHAAAGEDSDFKCFKHKKNTFLVEVKCPDIIIPNTQGAQGS